MHKTIPFAALLTIALPTVALSAENSSVPSPPGITREILPSMQIAGEERIDHIEIQKISMAANQRPGAHIHTSAVVGYVIEGTIVLQVEGQAEQTLRAGDVFYEPRDTVISRFDSDSQPAKFVAYYLLGKGEKSAVKMVR